MIESMAIVFLNGRYLDEREARLSVNDAGFLYGEGVYETLRTVGGEVLNVDAHLERLSRSAKMVGIPLPAGKKVADWLQKVVDKNGFWKKGKESRIRLTISGGIHAFDELPVKPTILIQVQPLVEVSRVKLACGVSAISYSTERFMPQFKTTHLLPALLARREMRKAKAYEVLLLNAKGQVTEGSISNVFLVRRGRLITPKSCLLKGTTRYRILQLAKRLKIVVSKKDFRLASVYGADEVFICNAPRGIVPIVKVDGKRIGNGKVGKVAGLLMREL